MQLISPEVKLKIVNYLSPKTQLPLDLSSYFNTNPYEFIILIKNSNLFLQLLEKKKIVNFPSFLYSKNFPNSLKLNSLTAIKGVVIKINESRVGNVEGQYYCDSCVIFFSD